MMRRYSYQRRQWHRARVAGPAVITLSAVADDWPQFWSRVRCRLRERGYTTSTLRIYRHVLRSFKRWSGLTPARVTAAAVKAYIMNLADRQYSWAWISGNISALRVVFDGLCGLSVCDELATPKRPHHLPVILNRGEIWRLLSAADTARDQLLLGLMYGSGLKVGEVCALKWADVDCRQMELRIGAGDRARSVPYASRLGPLLEQGLGICAAGEYIFRGNRDGTHLSTRMAEYVLRRAAGKAGIEKPVYGMSLRHSYAVHRLEDGASLREVQAGLGLRNIHSATVYLRCMLPVGAYSPLEAFAQESAGAPKAPQVPAPDMPVALPFEPVSISAAERARLFFRSLKLRIRHGFLSLREAADSG